MSMIVVASANGRVGIVEAMEVLRRGGSALDAVETGTRLVEDNLEDHTVGHAGLPNLLGEVELDASIMDGRTLAAGAVAAIVGEHHAAVVQTQDVELDGVDSRREGRLEALARVAGGEQVGPLVPDPPHRPAPGRRAQP